VDPATIDFSHIAYDVEAIRKINKQRFEMEQLTAIVSMDIPKQIVIAYKDVTDDEFWVRGHIPGRPLMPGVVMCEAAAQTASFFLHFVTEEAPSFIGFGGLEDVRFRGTVVPGDRFVVVGHIISLKRRLFTFDAQAFVGTKMVFEGKILGVPI
jgi:3-hydroxyacyl-[acyl-carrier-protein] dehydratase